MAKKRSSGGGSKGLIGGLFTTSNIVKTVAAAGFTLWALNEVNTSKPGEWFYKVGQWTGLKPKT